jgi:hypothetical protein
MATLVRATALVAGIIALSDVSYAAPCRHFSIWNFPWPQHCPAKQTGQFIREASPPTPSPASTQKSIQDGVATATGYRKAQGTIKLSKAAMSNVSAYVLPRGNGRPCIFE